MGLFKPRPKARIKIGNTFRGDKVNAIARGYVIYKEWDAEDHKHYYWEEWELTGFNDYDSWVEYDHYTSKVTLYEPFKVEPGINFDPEVIKEGQHIQTTMAGKSVTLLVKEIGVGTVARREGTLTHHVFVGEPLQYAEITYPGGVISVEKYNNKEFDVYKGKVLSKKQQKKLLGRSVQPLWIKKNWLNTLFTLFVIGISLGPMVIPSYETYCTPRSTIVPTNNLNRSPATPPIQIQQPSSRNSPTLEVGTPSNQTLAATTTSKDPVVSQDSRQTCYRRTVYGGGSGGAGK